MLDVCLPGYARKQREHNWLVTHGTRAYPRLPRNAHSKRADPDVQIGHVRHLVRFFQIQECAEAQLEQLRH
jgi:hypothetical protein